SQQVERARDAVGAYVETIDVPQYNAQAVRARATSITLPRAMPRWAAAVAAACVVLVAIIVATPSVRAQVERMLQAFAVIGGQQVPVAVNDVTLDQARRDMPFAVIAPAAIPAGLTPRIDELTPSSSRIDSHLMIQYEAAGGGPGLTIMESRAQRTEPTQMRFWMTTGAGAPPQMAHVMNNVSPGQHAFVQFRHDGTVTQRVKVEPISWVVRGTRVDLISPPGVLTPMQLAAIRRAMSH
ncbi:MAG TPA: hypothetical protein VIW73_09015, partial [Candidatus Cybelea sp.]